MKISSLKIRNYKSIRELCIDNVDYAVIFVGKNNTGKTVILDAIRVMAGDKEIDRRDFNNPGRNVEMEVKLEITQEDLELLRAKGVVSKVKNETGWLADFSNKLPGFAENELAFTFVATPDGKIFYNDGRGKHNHYIKRLLPKIYYIDNTRDLSAFEKDIFHFQGNQSMAELKEQTCIFAQTKKCNHCFECIKSIETKNPTELTVAETTRLLEYKLFHMNLNEFSNKLNQSFHRNSSKNDDIVYRFGLDFDKVFSLDTTIYNKERKQYESIHQVGAGTKSIYVLSLLETYIEAETSVPSIIMIEEPEMYLHPQLQKAASEMLYKLSKKNQVIFSTHSPNMLFNFSTKQIKQVVLDEHYSTVVREDEEIDDILDDLGYAAGDLMNVSFVFIVEGKDGRTARYYTRVVDLEQNSAHKIVEFAHEFHTTAIKKPSSAVANNVVYDALKYTGFDYYDDLSHVDIAASYKLMTFGDLKPNVITEVATTITEIDKDYTVVHLQYVMEAESGGATHYYNVDEYYTGIYDKSSGKVELLDYHRYQESMFDTEYIYIEEASNSWVWEKLGEQTLDLSDAVSVSQVISIVNDAIKDLASVTYVNNSITQAKQEIKNDISETLKNEYITTIKQKIALCYLGIYNLLREGIIFTLLPIPNKEEYFTFYTTIECIALISHFIAFLVIIWQFSIKKVYKQWLSALYFLPIICFGIWKIIWMIISITMVNKDLTRIEYILEFTIIWHISYIITYSLMLWLILKAHKQKN